MMDLLLVFKLLARELTSLDCTSSGVSASWLCLAPCALETLLVILEMDLVMETETEAEGPLVEEVVVCGHGSVSSPKSAGSSCATLQSHAQINLCTTKIVK